MCVCGDGGGVLTGSSERELKKVVKIKQVCMRSVCMWGWGRGVDKQLGEGTEGGGQDQTGLYAYCVYVVDGIIGSTVSKFGS